MPSRPQLALTFVLVLAILAPGSAQAACGFTLVPSPNKGDRTNFLSAIDAVSSKDVWAAGTYRKGPSDYSFPQTWHWNGKAWKLVKTPAPGPDVYGTNVGGIVGLRRGEAWLAGSWIDIPADFHPMLMHFTGRRWRKVKLPASVPPDAGLSGIDARGPGDVWVAGNDGSTSFVLHFNGRRWKKMLLPLVGTTSNSADDIAVVPGTKQVWVAGTYSGPALEAAYLARWNGKLWKTFAAPQPGPQVHLYDLDVRAKDNVWVAGYLTGQPNTWGGSTFHFDGSAWSYEVFPDPSTAFPGTFLYGIAAIGPNRAYAGGTTTGMGANTNPILGVWDGATWSEVTLPAVQVPAGLQAVSRIPGTKKVWIAGWAYDGTRSITVFFRGCAP
jgi:hypothetical protein